MIRSVDWEWITKIDNRSGYGHSSDHTVNTNFSRASNFARKLLQESPADAVKPARRKSMPKLLQFDVFCFISPNSISPNCQCIASRGKPIFSEALGLYSCTQFEIRCLPIIKIRTYSSSRSSKVIDLGVNRKPMYDFLLVTNSNLGRICYRFRDIDA